MSWGLIASFWVGNILLLILNLPLIGMRVRFPEDRGAQVPESKHCRTVM